MADEQPEEGFTIRDRRRFTGEGESISAAPETTPAAVSAPAPVVINAPEADAETDLYDEAAEEDEVSLPDVYSVLALFLGELRNLAWLRMGLVANPATGQIERDMPQARTAIDTVEFLAKQLEGVVAPEERLPLKALVSDLQVNFVEQTKRAA